jgi:hypothetical protein
MAEVIRLAVVLMDVEAVAFDPIHEKCRLVDVVLPFVQLKLQRGDGALLRGLCLRRRDFLLQCYAL